MARVIKGGGGGAPGHRLARPPTRVLVDAGQKKVIERELYQAKQDAEHILKRAEEERHRLLADGKRRAAQAREEAMARGASEAFALAASEALAAFRARAHRYSEAADDIRALALEVVKKVLGNDPDLGSKDVERILQKGLAELRARRRLRLQVPARRMNELVNERPNLMKALQNEPDLVIEGVDDVSVGFARVVTEIGGALCAEETALDALSLAVNVREQPRVRYDDVGQRTDVGTRPSELHPSQLPDALVEEDASDETIQMPAATQRMNVQTDDVEEIVAEEDRSGSVPRPPVNRVPTGTVQAPARAATRVVAIGVSKSSSDRAKTSRVEEVAEETDETLRKAPKIAARDEEEDLDLFTDDAVGNRKKRR